MTVFCFQHSQSYRGYQELTIYTEYFATEINLTTCSLSHGLFIQEIPTATERARRGGGLNKELQ